MILLQSELTEELQSAVYPTSTCNVRVMRVQTGIKVEVEQTASLSGDIHWFKQYVEDLDDALYAARIDFGVPETVKEKLHYLIFEIGAGFHPDNPIEDYVTDEGKQAYEGEELQRLSGMLNDCWQNLSTQIYGAALELYKSMFPEGYDEKHGEPKS